MTLELIGRLHPVLLHLPIGVFSAAFFMRYIYPRSNTSGSVHFRIMLLCGFISSIMAVVPGWVLSRSGDYDADAVQFHQWSAIAFTFILGGLYLMEEREFFLTHTALYHAVFFLASTAMLVAGHAGGTLTHGEGYLFSLGQTDLVQHKPLHPYGTKVPDTATLSVYEALVDPVLHKKCQSCHQATKIKGGLRLDGLDRIMKGGKSGKILVAGNPTGSEMMKRVHLPIDEEKHMPPKGKLQLTEKEIALLHWWILHGARPDQTVKDVSGNDTVKSFLASSSVNKSREEVLPLIAPADSGQLAKLKAAGFSIRPVASGSGWLDVSAVSLPPVKEKELLLLVPVAKNILWLNLSGQQVGNEGMTLLDSCINLSRLNLKDTKVSDDFALRLKDLSHLSYLNIVGTDFSDKGLMMLGSVKGLQQVYCWQTKVTKEGVAKFKRNHPRTHIEMGGQQ